MFHYNLAHVTGGYVGVDVFFVISGFLITGLINSKLERNTFSFSHFYERRARRILPALFMTCLISTLAALALLVPYDFSEFSKALMGAAFFYSNFVFARWVGYFADPLSTRPLLHTWSLAIEEQFYLLLPVLLFGLHKLLGGNRNKICAVVYVLCIVSMLCNVHLVSINPDRTFYLLHTRGWELLAGAIIALQLCRVRLHVLATEAMGLIGAGCLIISFFLYDRDTIFPGMAAVLPCAGAVFLIWSNLSYLTIVGRVLSSKFLVGIGLVSYGLYLYHWPALVFSRYYLEHELSSTEGAVVLTVVMALSVLSYRFIEKPLRSGPWLPDRKNLFRTAAVGLLLFGVVGWAGVYTKGFPDRFSGAALQYAAGAQDKIWESCRPASDRADEKIVCKVGFDSGSGADFLVWGDSHADSLEPAIDVVAKKYHVPGWLVSSSGCPSLVGAARLDPYNDFPCPQIARNVLELIRRNHIMNVLLVTRWDMYAMGWEKGSIETTREPAISFFTEDGRLLTHKEAFSAAFSNTIRALQALGVKIWIFEQVPPQLVHVPSALAKAVYFGRDLKTLKRPYQDIKNRRHFVDEVFSEFRDTPSVFFIDPTIKFCPQKLDCLIESNGHSLYMDNGHLSVYGALWSKDMLDPFFKSMQIKQIKVVINDKEVGSHR